MTYLFVLALIIYGIFAFDFNKSRRNNYHLYYFIVFYLIIISSLAYRMGDDGIGYEMTFPTYKTLFEADLSYYFTHDYKAGWVILSSICKTFTNSFVLFRLVFSLTVNLIITNFIKKNISYPYLSLLFYVFLIYIDFNFSIMRQALAISIFIYSLRYFENSEWKKYILCNLIAASFHDSALLVLILPLFRNFVFKGKKLIIFIICLSIIIYFASDIVEYYLNYSFNQEGIFARLQIYKGKSDEVSLSFTNLAINVIFPILLLNKVEEKADFKYYRFFVLCYIIMSLFASLLPIAYRLVYFFIPIYVIFLIEAIVYCVNHISFSYVLNTILCLSLSISYLCFKKRLWLLPLDEVNIPRYIYFYPYTSVIFEEKIQEREIAYNNSE